MIVNGKPLPPIYFFLAVLAMTAGHYYFPIVRWIEPPYTYLGWVLIGLAAVFIFWAAGLFGKAGTTVKPYHRSKALVTTGPYRFTRNPMYLGMIGVLTGISITFGTLSPFLVIPPFAFLIQEKFIKMEEEMLEEAFGEEYRAFRKRVRRWI